MKVQFINIYFDHSNSLSSSKSRNSYKQN